MIENVNAGWYTILTNQYRLPPTASLLRLLIQQSNYFVVVERGAAGMAAMNRERELQNSGQMRKGSNFGGGQMVSSDFGLSPEVIFNEGNASGSGALIGGLIGGAALGGYTNTPQDNVIAAAFMDGYNGMVISLRQYRAQEVKGGLGKGGQLPVGR